MRFAILANISFRKCSEALKLVKEDIRADMVLLAGGFTYCHTLAETVPCLGINALEDDILASKILKRHNAYVAGRWVEVSERVFVGGIDGVNPVQNLQRLVNSVPLKPKVLIILSRYPPCGSCSQHKDLAQEFCMPELSELLERIPGDTSCIFVVGSFLHKRCVGSIGNCTVYVINESPQCALLIEVSIGGLIRTRFVCKKQPVPGT
ncbi:MAG: hypothetical protein DRO12_05250 [Thermoprotei archaeon]|nr:MAG: hypothetical protein DRO12_05250 [Thermoprotei archaeon]